MKTNFRNLMKNKIFIGCVSAVLVVIIAITAVMLIPNKTDINTSETTSDTSDVTVSTPDITISGPNNTATSSDPETSNALETGVGDISVDVGGNGTNNTNSGGDSNTSKTPAESGAAPVVTSKPEEESNIVIGGDEPEQSSYSCGMANHHCINAENHVYILNLELEGCPYCGSHSCVSFYYVSPAGIPMCNPSLCPKYNEKSDPIKYCQECGKKNGDGTNGTCVQFINACNCPNCGEYVEARTCHTCK